MNERIQARLLFLVMFLRYRRDKEFRPCAVIDSGGLLIFWVRPRHPRSLRGSVVQKLELGSGHRPLPAPGGTAGTFTG
jgi:hypothetical protein